MFNKPLSALSAVIFTALLFSASSVADPGNGHGNGNGKGNGNGNGNHGNAHAWKQQGSHGNGNVRGNPHNAQSDVSFSFARGLAVDYGFTGYKGLPPGIAKNLARGKPLPPGIAKRAVPQSMLGRLPYYPGYEWRIVGDDLVLIALSTAVVTAIINGVFD